MIYAVKTEHSHIPNLFMSRSLFSRMPRMHKLGNMCSNSSCSDSHVNALQEYTAVQRSVNSVLELGTGRPSLLLSFSLVSYRSSSFQRRSAAVCRAWLHMRHRISRYALMHLRAIQEFHISATKLYLILKSNPKNTD